MLRQTTPSSPLSHGLVPPSNPVLGSSGSGCVLGTFRPHFLPVFSSPSFGGSLGWALRPPASPPHLALSRPCSHPSALPGAGPAFPHLPLLLARPASAGSCSRTLTAPLWPWPIHPLGLSHPRRHQAVLKRPAVLLGCLLGPRGAHGPRVGRLMCRGKRTHVSAAAPRLPGPPLSRHLRPAASAEWPSPCPRCCWPSPGVLGPV